MHIGEVDASDEHAVLAKFESVAGLVQYRLCLADAEDEDTALFEAKDDPVAMPVARITLHDISIQPGKYDLDDIKSVRMQFTTGPPEVSAPCLSAVGVLAACATIMRE